ncbi:MAG: hypothetical protein MUC85_13445 [Anaerolineales bacterium]|nr:hypothetical protein [Anaerolineales bacterium]
MAGQGPGCICKQVVHPAQIGQIATAPRLTDPLLAWGLPAKLSTQMLAELQPL